MKNRDRIIQKINVVLDDASDVQLKKLEAVIGDIILTEDYCNLYEPHSDNFTQNGMQSTATDVEEGNWGTLYRSPDSEKQEGVV